MLYSSPKENVMPRPKTAAAKYKKLMFRLPEDLLEFVQQAADANQRSLNGQLLYVLLDWKAKERPRAARRARED
jgi:hypothetical protein